MPLAITVNKIGGLLPCLHQRAQDMRYMGRLQAKSPEYFALFVRHKAGIVLVGSTLTRFWTLFDQSAQTSQIPEPVTLLRLCAKIRLEILSKKQHPKPTLLIAKMILLVVSGVTISFPLGPQRQGCKRSIETAAPGPAILLVVALE